ncbi:hypothetical protein H6790_02645 [Candidatus Nomurabacteria bacterium]|nr:hypothetical protein [Candidatus Nomurabacteria bacterium]MCB9820819.1 hypothetical protein [Candidatus Nomurabacteria bacterium]
MNGLVKKLIIGTVIFILLVIAWRVFTGSQNSPEELVRSSGGNTLTDIGGSSVEDTFVDTLLNVSTITIDTSLWSEKAYSNLRDFSVILIPESVGRDNPYLPTTTSVSAAEGEVSSVVQ